MVPLFGMAGLAEAGEAFGLTIGYGGLLLLGVAAGVDLFARSQVASGIALTLALAITLMFTPWEAFRPFESADPDVQHWVAAWRWFGCWWGFAVAAAVGAAVRAFGKAPRQPDNQPVEQGATADRPRD